MKKKKSEEIEAYDKAGMTQKISFEDMERNKENWSR